MIEYLVLFAAIPLGYMLAGLTRDEKEIYLKKPYFPIMIPALAGFSFVSYFWSREIFFASLFMVILLVSWKKFD